jgi:hypothetical protein
MRGRLMTQTNSHKKIKDAIPQASKPSINADEKAKITELDQLITEFGELYGKQLQESTKHNKKKKDASDSEEKLSLTIINNRHQEMEHLTSKKRQHFFAAIDAQIALLTTLKNFELSNEDEQIGLAGSIEIAEPEETSEPKQVAEHEPNELLDKAQAEYKSSISNAKDKIVNLTYQFMKDPTSAVPINDIKLFKETTANLSTLYKNPINKDNIVKVANNAQEIYKKIGTYWETIKQAIAAVVGISLIITGILGLVPTFTASVSTIVAGATMLAGVNYGLIASHFQSKEQPKKSADAVSKDLQKITKDAKHLLTMQETKDPEKTQIKNVKPGSP